MHIIDESTLSHYQAQGYVSHAYINAMSNGYLYFASSNEITHCNVAVLIYKDIALSGLPETMQRIHAGQESGTLIPFQHEDLHSYDIVDPNNYGEDYKMHMMLQFAFPDFYVGILEGEYLNPQNWEQFEQRYWAASQASSLPEQPKRGPGRPRTGEASPTPSTADKIKRASDYQEWVAQCKARKQAIGIAKQNVSTRRMEIRVEKNKVEEYLHSLRTLISQAKAGNDLNVVNHNKQLLRDAKHNYTLQSAIWANELDQLKMVLNNLKATPAPERPL